MEYRVERRRSFGTLVFTALLIEPRIVIPLLLWDRHHALCLIAFSVQFMLTSIQHKALMLVYIIIWLHEHDPSV